MFLLHNYQLAAQDEIQKEPKTGLTEEEEGPLVLKFEPKFLTSVEVRRAEMKRTRQILDTLDISERRRKKLLKDLYKNGLTKRLSKAILVDTQFEDDIEE